jgi:signal transduction histidine kinase
MAAASGTAGQAGWGRLAQLLLRPLVSARTWLAIIHLLAGSVIGLVAFIFVVTGTSVGVALLPVALLGIPVLAALMWLCGQLGVAERARFALLLGDDIPAPPPPADHLTGWRRAWQALAGPVALRQYLYAAVRFPLGLAEALVVLLAWSVGAALAFLPAYDWAVPPGYIALGNLPPQALLTQVGAAAVGLVLLLSAPWLTGALAAADTAVARLLLGAPRGAELTARIGHLERSRADVVDAAGAERRRLERDLHDGAQQRLVSLAMELGRAKAKFATDPAAAEEIVGQAHEQAKEALAELRNLVRGVHPPVLSDRGLDAALSGLAALSPVPVNVKVMLAERPPGGIEAIAYFVVAEALTNVAKHARATRAAVVVEKVMAGQVVAGKQDGMLRVAVHDDGIGGASPAGRGLSGLASRAAAVDGRMTVTSPAGGPTTVEVLLPCG